MKGKIRLAGMIQESVSNGDGLRRVLFAQGCRHNCKGCFNPETHDFSGGELVDMDEIIEGIKVNPILRGITFSGGDPFEQAEEFSYLAKEVRKLGKNVWCYTGYTFEYILGHLNNKGWEQLLYNIDMLVDGKFEQDKRNKKLKFRGSSNQRIINVQQSLKENNIILIVK